MSKEAFVSEFKTLLANRTGNTVSVSDSLAMAEYWWETMKVRGDEFPDAEEALDEEMEAWEGVS